MPFQGVTPESLIARADSKNPATTCRGLTTNGRPCRRGLASSARNSPASSPGGRPGVIALFPGGRDAAIYYCWQHKDQADALADESHHGVQVVDLQKRSSTDSLAARLGILSIDRKKKKKGRDGRPSEMRPATGTSRLQQPGSGQGNRPQSKPARPAPQAQRPDSKPVQRKARRERGNVHISLFCCMHSSDLDESDHSPPVRPVQQAEHFQKTGNSTTAGRPSPAAQGWPGRPDASPLRSPLAFLPPTANPATIALLSAELAKPLTASDREPGYIYIFWIVPKSTAKPASSDASALLAPPSSRPESARRTSDLLRQYSVRAPSRSGGGSNNNSNEHRTIMLKIGRANNVQRRMNEWTRQCGEDIMLVRYYPYHSPSSPSPSPSPSPRRSSGGAAATRRVSSSSSPPSPGEPRKVRLVPRVERLVQLELQEQRVMRECDGCGKRHREWFQVAATKAGVKAVDETVRRWVLWAEAKDGEEQP